jgi:hypothetical protein
MFAKTRIRRDMADIRALLTECDPAAGPLEASAIVRLAVLGHRLITEGPGREVPDGRAAATGANGQTVVPTTPAAVAGKGRSWWPNHRQRQRRRKIVITCVAVPALAAATAAGWVIASSQPADRLAANIVCFASAREKADGNAVVPATGRAPTAVCAQLWASGVVITGHHSVPRLVACSLRESDGGTIAVFPDTTCAAEHLPPLPPGYQAAASQFVRLEKALNADGISPQEWLSNPPTRCVSKEAGIAYAQRALQRSGLTGWQIVVGKFGPQARCAYAEATSSTHSVQVFGGAVGPGHP